MRYLRISFLLLMMSAACLLTGCAHKNKTDEMSSKERKALAEYKVKSYQEGKTKYKACLRMLYYIRRVV